MVLQQSWSISVRAYSKFYTTTFHKAQISLNWFLIDHYRRQSFSFNQFTMVSIACIHCPVSPHSRNIAFSQFSLASMSDFISKIVSNGLVPIKYRLWEENKVEINVMLPEGTNSGLLSMECFLQTSRKDFLL